MTTPTVEHTTTVSDDVVTAYRHDGVVRIPNVLEPDDVARLRTAAEAAKSSAALYSDRPIFTQVLNIWKHDTTLRELTFNKDLARIATQLAGVPLRLWHDHLLIKEPHNETPTEWHQDQPNWPIASVRHALSAWVALVDVPAERGCMTFIPGTQDLTGLPDRQPVDQNNLSDAPDEVRFRNRVTIPLRAGDCTFHNAKLFHSAMPNSTDEPRIAHVVVYVDAETTATAARPHPVLNHLDLEPGDRLPDNDFPRLP